VFRAADFPVDGMTLSAPYTIPAMPPAELVA